MKTLDSYTDPPLFWGGYIDDDVAVINTSTIESFTFPSYQSKPEYQVDQWNESNHTLAMLDPLITRKAYGLIKFSVYHKLTHTDQYLQFDSR